MAFLFYSLGVLLLLGCSAFFSSSETALFSLPKITVARLRASPSTSGRTTARLLDKPQELLGTILIGNLLVNVSASSLFTLLAITLVERFNLPRATILVLSAVFMTILLLATGEITPKVLAVRNAEPIAHTFAPIIDLLRRLLLPVNFLLGKLGALVIRPTKHAPFPTGDELQTMVEMGKESGVLGEDEETIIWNLVELARRSASEVMTPRRDIVGLEAGAQCERALELVRRTQKSRFPVYEKTIDRVKGILYAKDLLGLIDPSQPVAALARPAYFVPESKKLSVLLEEFRRHGIHVAVVVDEFGQTAGLVTLEDILEGILGEILDEYDLPSEIPYVQVDTRTYLVRGDIDLRTLNRLFRRAFRNVRHARLAGFIHDQLGTLPAEGQTFRVRSLEFKIEKVTGRRIEQVLIRRVEPAKTKAS